jgi:hypothetical protein
MKTLGALPSLRVSRNPLVAFGLFIIVIFVAYKAAQAILANDLNSLAFAGLLVVGGAVFVAILNDWRRGLYLLVAWILFEDLVRKYLSNNMAIYFAKDILALILYLSFFRAGMGKKVERFSIPFRVPLMIFFWFCLLQMFNPASTSIFYGILGIKVNFLYVPLLYIGYAFIQSEEDLRRFFTFVSVLILIVAGLGLAQSIIGPTFLNPAVLQDDIRDLSTTYRAAPISGLLAYRPTSVFVSAGRFQDFLTVAWLISLGFAGYLLLRTRQGRTLAFTTIGVVAAASIMSASRGVFMWNAGTTLVTAAGFLWGAPWRQREAIRILRAIMRTSLLIGMGLIILLTIFPQELGSRVAIYSETLMPDSPASELIHRTQTYPLLQLEYAFEHPRWPYGYGLGTCTLGTQYVRRIMGATHMGAIGVESGFGNLVVELGILGLILWIVLGCSIAISAWMVVTQLRGSPWFPLAFAICLYAVILIFPMMFTGNSPYQDFVLNADLWLFLGILYRLRLFPKAVQLAQAQASSGQG